MSYSQQRLKQLRISELEKERYQKLKTIQEKEPVIIREKVRLADIFTIDNSGISNELYSYALQAYFDVVIYSDNRSGNPLFAIEFDEQHEKYEKALERDRKKDELCKRFGLPLLRIDEKVCYGKVGKIASIMLWLADLFFLEQAFHKSQANGEIPYDEPFMYFAFLDSYRSPFMKYRSFIQKQCKEGKCAAWATHDITGRHPTTGNYHSISILYVKPGEITIIGQAKTRYFINYTAISNHELAGELALVDCALKFQDYLNGKWMPPSEEENINLIQKIKSYDDVIQQGLDAELFFKRLSK